MLEFARKALRELMNIILWINLIVFIIIGISAGRLIAITFWGDDPVGYAVLGAIIGIIAGIIIGLLSNIVLGGFIATIINMDKNLEKQNKLSELLLIHYGVLENNNIENDNEIYQEDENVSAIKYRAKELLEVKSIPDSENKSIFQINNDEVVYYFHQAYEEVKTKIIWYKIKYNDVIGWCESKKLEKIN